MNFKHGAPVIIRAAHVVGALSCLLVTWHVGVLRSAWVATPFPVSVDSFYYLVELRSHLQTGSGYYHAYSLFFELWSGIAQLFNCSEREAFTLMVYSGIVCLATGFAACGARKSAFAGLCFAFTALNSEVLFGLAYEFPRQATASGVVLIGFGLWRYQRSSWLAWGGIVLAALGAVQHVFAAAITALLIAFEGTVPSRVRITLLSVLASAVGLYLLYLPREVGGLFEAAHGWPWSLLHSEGRISTAQLHEHRIAFTLWLAIVIVEISRDKRCLSLQSALLLCGYFVMILPFWGNSAPSYAQRFLVSSPLLLIPALALLLQAETGRRPLVATCSLLAFGAFMLSHTPEVTGHRKNQPHDPDTAWLLDHAEKLQRWIPQNAVILAPHGTQFKITYFLNRRSASRIPRDRLDALPYYFQLTRAPLPESRCEELGTSERDIPSGSACVKLKEGRYISRFGPPDESIRSSAAGPSARRGY